jgi:hypothetical protein
MARGHPFESGSCLHGRRGLRKAFARLATHGDFISKELKSGDSGLLQRFRKPQPTAAASCPDKDPDD